MTSATIESESVTALLRAVQQERQLTNARLTAARGTLVNRIQERQLHDRERLSARLRGADVPEDLAATIATIDADVAQTESAIRPLMNEYARLDAEILRLQAIVNTAAEQGVQARATALYSELVPVLVRLDELSVALSTLHEQNPGTVRLLTHPGTVREWLAAARAQTTSGTL